MRRKYLWFSLVFLAVAPLRAEPKPDDKPARETWDAVYLEGAKAGYFHTIIREGDRDGQKRLAAVQTMQLNVKREGSVVQLRIETGSEETADGKVLGLSLTQFAGKTKVTQTGRVEGDQLVVRSSNGDEVLKLPWNDAVLGLARQDRLFADRKVKPGDRFSYLGYEISLQAQTTMQVAVKDNEDVDLLEVKKDGDKVRVEHVKKSLLRVEVVPDKVKVGNQTIQLPTLTAWLDKDLQPVRSEMELTGLGRFTLYRTTEAVAKEEGAAPALLPDLLLNNLISLNKAIERPQEAKEVVYRITLKGDDDPAAAFVHDARQEAKNLADGSCELRVKAQRDAAPVENAVEPGDEFGKSSYFLDSSSEKIKALAADIVGAEKDPWRKGQRIEKWVHDHMKVATDVNYVPASQTAADLRGDCRQHAMLTAALCRAAKLPARTALGLVYDKDPDRGPVLAFHMWTEVWAKGQWLGLDAVWGEGGVGADHIKIAEHSWGDTQNMAPLLAVTRVMGKARVEVVSEK